MTERKLVEVDESVFTAGQKTVEFVRTLMGNPKAKKLLLQAEKTIYPDKKIPEIDEPDPRDLEIEALKKRQDEWEKKTAAEKDEREKAEKLAAFKKNIDDGLAKLRASGVTDEGITAVQKLMDERGIADPEIAFAYLEKMNPPAAPSDPVGSGSWNLFEPSAKDDDYVTKLIKSQGEDEFALRKQVNDTLKEIRGR